MKLPAVATPDSCSIPGGGGGGWRIEDPLKAALWADRHGAPDAPAPVSRRKRRVVAGGGRWHLRRQSSPVRQTGSSAQAHPLFLPISAGCSSTGLRRLGAVERRKRKHCVWNKGLLCLTLHNDSCFFQGGHSFFRVQFLNMFFIHNKLRGLHHVN